ncbi:MAG: AMP-binding protein [Roseomonas sp.]|nr:AMP-binding protein [Roseomonas sp.]MCA3328399.1 AMP-binding protein [Roseomonas sp.]MCA3330859.1 AMP-binding protein [Roseomonas sp.]MCA3333942.1 AMP-binding protein [Roseomonas sp.]MCA3346768.1 AMP-binding protein [Roseomonas sp.]
MPQLAQWAASWPEKIAAVFPDSGAVLRFGALDARANQVANGLLALGLAPGQAVALLLENSPDFLVLTYGAKRAGLMVTPLSIHLRPNEVLHVLRDSGAVALVADASLGALVAKLDLAAIPHRFATGGELPGFASLTELMVGQSSAWPAGELPIGREFLYSSGTTGLPKGIRRPLIAYADRLAPEFDMSWQQLYGFDEKTIYLSPAPLYHAAPNRYVQRTINLGGTAIILRKFDAARCLAVMAEYGVTHSQWVPTMFVRLLALPPEIRAAHDLSHHRCAIHAAAPCPAPVKRAMLDWWGPIIWEYYAGSEGIGTCVIDSATWLRKPGSVGRPVYGRVHILDDGGKSLPAGEIGRIWFEGGARFAYHNDPIKTAEAYNDRGWATLHDLGWLDEDGFLFLSDRRADLILSGGVNVYPAEIEAVLMAHPRVSEAAVIGVKDAEFGERPRALVVARDGAGDGALAEELLALCRAELAGPKQPRAIEFVAELPRSEAGKLLRRVLKERYL